MGLRLKAADPAADIGLINGFTVRELTPEEVFCFSVVLCDNDVDRDLERFTDDCLKGLSTLFLGKTVLMDHWHSAEKQMARLYALEVEDTDRKTALGTPLKELRGKAYMLRTETNKDLIAAIEGGILKEVSVGCSVAKRACSICGKRMCWSWDSGCLVCDDGHVQGMKYPEGTCVCELSEPVDAYELSFVAVPAQRNAGVRKAAGADVNKAVAVLLECGDLAGAARFPELVKAVRRAMLDEAEKAERAEILRRNAAYLRG